MTAKVFIDRQEGTTGLEIYAHLRDRHDVELLVVDEKLQKNIAFKRARYKEADVVVWCLPDAAARDAIELDPSARFLDASTAHRTAQGWVYGLPELEPTTRQAIINAPYVSNPGCYPRGILLAVRPLTELNLIQPSQKLQVHAVSGYSGGGKKLIERYATELGKLMDTRIYGLCLQHKQVPEMRCHSGLAASPFFLPAVGPFYRGMIVKVALPHTDANAVHAAWRTRYADEPFVRVMLIGGGEDLADGFSSAELCNHTNRVDLLVASHGDETVVCAVLVNLGKGASAAAVQNLNLMLGIEETRGLCAFV